MSGGPRLATSVASNYASQIFVAAAGLVAMPLYLRFMSVEAFGLVGFFVLLQALFNLLDLGLSPTVTRESARFRGGAISALEYRRVARALQLLFVLVGLAGGATLFLTSDLIARRWLGDYDLPTDQVRLALQLMAVGVALRWMAGIYRGMVTGAEQIPWLSGFNALIGLLRFLAVIPVLAWLDATPATFFAYQIGVSTLELAGLVAKSWASLPKVAPDERIGWSMRPVAPLLRFSSMIAVTATVGVLITQVDKLVLSTVLSLEAYGYFTLAVAAANGVLLCGLPMSVAIMPRMARLEAEGLQLQAVAAYREATQFVALLSGVAAATAVVCAVPLLVLWIGDAAIAARVAPIFALYSIGNAIFTVAAFPYYLQYAKGDLRLHLIGNLAFATLFIPGVVFVASRYGAIGAGWCWLGLNLLSLFAWLPFVHRKFVPGLNRLWYGTDVFPIAAAIGGFALLLHWVLPAAASVPGKLAEILLVASTSLVVGVAASSFARRRLSAIRNRR